MDLMLIKDFALATENKHQEVYAEHSIYTLNIDQHIAKYLEYQNPEFITTIHSALETYN